jgi:hypothetical protein
MPFLWSWAQRFRQNPELKDLNGDLARSRFGNSPFNANDISCVQLAKLPICFLTDIVEPNQNLDSPRTVHQIGEGEFAMLPKGCQPTRNPNRLTLQSFVVRNNFHRQVGTLKLSDSEWVNAFFSPSE